MEKKRVIALGFFDGVHLGHQALLSRCREAALQLDAAASVLTFSNHPDTLLKNRSVKTLTITKQRVEMLKRIGGADEVLLLPFDEDIMRLSWQDYFQEILIKRYHACYLIAGENHRFGYKGLGNAGGLRKKCAEYSLGCDIISDIQINGQTVSSTKIREFIEHGDIESANLFLGHPHEIMGEVLHGRGIGSKRLVPTVNMESVPDLLLPPNGVYITRIRIGEEIYPAITNIGVRPTFGESGSVTIETNAFGFAGDAYGKTANIELWRFLRPERQFKTADALHGQITKDIFQAKEFFNAR